MFLVALTLLSSLSFAQDKVIYGEDNRLDIFQVEGQAWVDVGAATAVQIKTTDFPQGGGKGKRGRKQVDYVFTTPTLGAQGICPSERFVKQPAVGNCSGFLIDEKTLVTAGHCMISDLDCSDYKWVFDYRIDSADVDHVRVPKTNVYECKRIVKQVLEREGGRNDFAVIELDRPVTDRRPLKVRESGTIEVGTPIVVAGYPSGLPLKLAGGAQVRSVNSTFLVANLDTYGGNSGSAVLNALTMEVEGILVRGDTDYVSSPEGCRVSNRVPDNGGRGEDVTLIGNIKAALSR
jgi:V8-like Glu-specific endopeptidase